MGAITESFFTGRMMMKINWKKYVAFFCMALVLLAVFPSVMTVSAYSGGSGTANDPYLIATASDFLNIKNNPGKVFRQTCDISFDGISFVPISSFSGTYDGGGFVLADISYSGTLDGVFVNNSGTIRNLALENCNWVSRSAYVNDYVGGLVAENRGTVINCSFSGRVTVDISIYTSFSRYCGAIVGRNYNLVENCLNRGSVTISAGNMSTAAPAGIVGYNVGTVRNCLNEGTIKATNAANTACGGIVGYNAGTVRSVKNIGAVSGASCWHKDNSPSTSAYVGGVVGQNRGTVSYAQNYGDIEASGTASGDHAYAGGIAGKIST